MSTTWLRWPQSLATPSGGPIGFGGDYNPERWPARVAMQALPAILARENPRTGRNSSHPDVPAVIVLALEGWGSRTVEEEEVSAGTWIRWPEGLREAAGTASGPLGFGGDYNPEQWPREVWDEDVALMREAGVNLVTVGVFSWAKLQPTPDTWDFAWLDEVLDLLHAGGIAVDLATATASPPPWLTTAHPEMLPVTRDGVALGQGARQAYCVSSPIYREHSLRLVRAMAQRYQDHPALAMWHVSNELGCHNCPSYSPAAALAFRQWLRERYGSLEALNEAWGTSFWSQHYSEWEQVCPPAAAPSFLNPTQQLDFARFSSDAQREQLDAEAAVLREVSPGVPITTNFMLMEGTKQLHYASWADSVDLVSNDYYEMADDPEAYVDVAFAADRTRGMAHGAPWMLMESSTSAVNWQPVNRAKDPAHLRRSSLAQVARGADAVCFFQWRQSQAGAEKYHSALVPHAGADSRLFRSVVSLGQDLRALAPVAGTRVMAEVALWFDWESQQAGELDAHPSSAIEYYPAVKEWYRALWRAGVSTDVIAPGDELAGYRIIVVPSAYLMRAEHAAALAAAAQAGAQVVVGYFSGIADGADHVYLGGYPGALRELLGIRVEEFFPLRHGEQVQLQTSFPAAGAAPRGEQGTGSATLWSEPVDVVDAEPLAHYTSGQAAGFAAITRARRGDGAAWYVSCEVDRATRETLLGQVLTAAGVTAPVVAPPGVEIVRRVGQSADGGRAEYVFAINHLDEDVSLDMAGRDLVSGTEVSAPVTLAAGDVIVLEQ